MLVQYTCDQDDWQTNSKTGMVFACNVSLHGEILHSFIRLTIRDV